MRYDHDDFSPAERLARWAVRTTLVGIGAALLVIGFWVYTQIQIERQLRRNMSDIIRVLNYNLQEGTVKIPPDMSVVPPAPAAASHPAPVPSPAGSSGPTK